MFVTQGYCSDRACGASFELAAKRPALLGGATCKFCGSLIDEFTTGREGPTIDGCDVVAEDHVQVETLSPPFPWSTSVPEGKPPR